jgi:hypothetical protein
MLATEILTALDEVGVSAWVNGDKLLVQPKNKIPLELVPEIRRCKLEIMQSISSTALDEKLTLGTEQTLLRLKAGIRWLAIAHSEWVDGKPNAPTDDRFSTALEGWELLERKLRDEFGYEGCVLGPDQRCPDDGPVMCDACLLGDHLP